MAEGGSIGLLFGISVTIAKVMSALGIVLLVTGVLLLWRVMRHRNLQSRPLSSSELTGLLTEPPADDEGLIYSKVYGATGRNIEFSFNIDTLRNAFFLFVIGVALFMPWAAVHKNIDSGVESPARGNPPSHNEGKSESAAATRTKLPPSPRN